MKINQHAVGMARRSRNGIFLTDRCSGAFVNHIAKAALLGFMLAVIVVLVTAGQELQADPGLGINPRLGDNVDANAGWKLPWGIALIPLVPCFGALLLFVSGIVKSGLTGQKILKREQRKPDGAHPPALDKFTEAFLIIRERQQKAVDEKTRV